MGKLDYLMEDEEEAIRLDMKTDVDRVKKQALWAGIKAGMTVADIGCGAGKTTYILRELVEPGGYVVGVDGSEKRIEYAKNKYLVDGVEFYCRDILKPLDDLGMFDFVWIRFLLEYYKKESFDIIKNISNIIKPGGILCLIDLDYNCLSHYGIPERLEKVINLAMNSLMENANFDPFMGRRLYSFIYDLGFYDIRVDVTAHHLIYGELSEVDEFNWMKKIEVISRKINYESIEGAGGFERFLMEFNSLYKEGYEEFLEEFNTFFKDPRRFTYTPVILCCGRKPFE
jgi:SAM-dependent methyltransferase